MIIAYQDNIIPTIQAYLRATIWLAILTFVKIKHPQLLFVQENWHDE